MATFRLYKEEQLSDYVSAIAWSTPQQWAAISVAGEVVLWDSQRHDLQTATDQPLSCLGFSPDGQFLAVAGQEGYVKVWQVDSKKLIATLDHSIAWIDCLAWSPTENLLAFGVNRQLKIWHPDSQETINLDFVSSSVFSIAWHPTGKYLAVAGNGGVKIWYRHDWMDDPTFLQVPSVSLDTAWSKHGKYLAAGNLERNLSVLEWGNPPPWLMRGFPGKVGQVTWSQNESTPMLASACQDGIAVWQLQGENWQSYILDRHDSKISAIAFGPNSSLLASADHKGLIYLWEDAKNLIQELKGEASFTTIAWSPGGNYLAAGGEMGKIMIWSAQ